MSSSDGMYHAGNRALQDQFGSRALADRLLEKTCRKSFLPADKSFIESAAFFFLATADAHGRPDCSFKGGAPGFVKVTGENLLVFPDYDGNGMFKSLGNIAVNPAIGMLFIQLTDKPRRLRINGRAQVSQDGRLIKKFVGAQMVIEIEAQHIFVNCPRYIPDLEQGSPSPYVPCAGAPRVEPAWKSFDEFKDVVPPRKA